MAIRSAIASALRHLAPHLPAHEFAAVVDHAMDSPGLSVASPENAAWLSLVAYARHTLTDYDALLAQGYDRDSARFFVAEELGDLLAGWGVKRKLGEASKVLSSRATPDLIGGRPGTHTPQQNRDGTASGCPPSHVGYSRLVHLSCRRG